MVEVHPPEAGIHSFRDFLLHLLTITIGLLIALGLDAGVEKLHQRSLRIEATENIRQEMEHNRKELAESRNAIEQEKSNLIGMLKFLQARVQSKPYNIRSLSLNFILATTSDASWRTASATGVIGYMNYSRVQEYAGVYEVQGEFTALQRETFNAFTRLQSYVVYDFDPGKMTPEQASAAAVDVRQALAYLQTLEQIEASLAKIYDRAVAQQ
jgi:hypothetical protein